VARIFSACILIASGLFLLSWGVPLLYQAGDVRGWPAISGTLAQAELLEEQVHTETGVQIRYIPVLRYNYEVDGRQFAGSRLGIAPSDIGSPEEAAAFRYRYKPESTIRVYYDPYQPDQAFLDRSLPGYIYPSVIAGAVLLIGGIYGILAGIRRRIHLRRNPIYPAHRIPKPEPAPPPHPGPARKRNKPASEEAKAE
jgi:hypothetical protein